MRLGFIIVAVAISVSSNAQKKMPEWVAATPVDEWSYYGVGIAAMEESVDYREKARKKALREIAEKIYVNIRSESNLYLTYEDEYSRYALREDVKTTSTNFLEGYQKVSDWVDKKNDIYYVLFKLDKAVHERNRKKYIDYQLSLINDFEDRAMELFLKEEYTTGFAYLESGLELAGDILKEYIEPHFQIKFKRKHSDLKSIYEDRLARLTIEVEKDEVLFDPMSKNPTRIYFKVKDRYTEKNISDLPVKLKVFSGDIFSYEIDSGSDNYFIDLKGVLPDEGVVEFRIIPDLKGEYLHTDIVTGKILKDLESGTIKVRFKSLPVRISSMIEERLATTRFIAFLENYLKLCSVMPVESEGYYYEIAFHPQIRFNRYSNEVQCIVWGDLLILNSTGDMEMRIQLPQGIARERSFSMAEQKSLDLLVSKMDPALSKLTEFLCSHKTNNDVGDASMIQN